MNTKNIVTLIIAMFAVLVLGGAALLQRHRSDLASLDEAVFPSETTMLTEEAAFSSRLQHDTGASETSAELPPLAEEGLPPSSAQTAPETVAAPPLDTPAATPSPVPTSVQAPAVTVAVPVTASPGAVSTAAAASTTPMAPPETTVAPLAPASTAEPSTDEAAAVFELVNQERTKAGLSPLRYDEGLAAAAQIRAAEIAESFSHTRPDGRTPFSVLQDVGLTYTMVAENIAYGQLSAEEVMQGWMNSEGHRANILTAGLTEIGVGLYQSGSTLYWVQLFRAV